MEQTKKKKNCVYTCNTHLHAHSRLLSWELHIPLAACAHVYDALMNAGEPLGLKNAGYHCLDSLSAEKGYRCALLDYICT